MPDGFSLAGDLARHIGQTVTIFTTSGGESGEGFTGVLASVSRGFVRLIVNLGSAPGCALGNCCTDERRRSTSRRNTDRRRTTGRFDCSGRTLGAVVDIPIDRIAAFVHNAVGSTGWQ
ncbi:hypothetical protein [Candidatus Clostridium radicumherbarum]|uniref:Uncharacterized protein n=1 Tax=Candidatus Clostridium radicumherbarum TaxID=3381662 RepID=A0ABW8TT01_9CLOT